jgi:chloramphenicol 3-O-phosphotransferase
VGSSASPGQIVALNGAPRSGKSSMQEQCAEAIWERLASGIASTAFARL